MADLRYPIGEFQFNGNASEKDRGTFIDIIETTPAKMRAAVKGFSDKQFDTPYRPGGWTVRQVVHHVPDSHLNAYIRLKLALTEEQPTIKPYEEARWAELVDGRTAAPEVSLSLLDSLNTRWVMLWRSLAPEHFSRTFKHPEHAGIQTVDWMLSMYAWHGRHHVAHITTLREREGWN